MRSDLDQKDIAELFISLKVVTGYDNYTIISIFEKCL